MVNVEDLSKPKRLLEDIFDKQEDCLTASKILNRLMHISVAQASDAAKHDDYWIITELRNNGWISQESDVGHAGAEIKKTTAIRVPQYIKESYQSYIIYSSTQDFINAAFLK